MLIHQVQSKDYHQTSFNSDRNCHHTHANKEVTLRPYRLVMERLWNPREGTSVKRLSFRTSVSRAGYESRSPGDRDDKIFPDIMLQIITIHHIAIIIAPTLYITLVSSGPF